MKNNVKHHQTETVTYKRESGKEKLEITGHPDRIMKFIWFDRTIAFMVQAVKIFLPIALLSSTRYLTEFWEWVRKQLFKRPPLLPVIVFMILLLSG